MYEMNDEEVKAKDRSGLCLGATQSAQTLKTASKTPNVPA
jgi:hypothetical protein